MIERVLERQKRTLINLNKMQFEFMPGKGIVDAIFSVIYLEVSGKRKRG